MPLQAPGTEGSVGLQHAPPARDETRASDKTRPAPGRDQKRDDRAVPSISSLPLSCRGRGIETPRHAPRPIMERRPISLANEVCGEVRHVPPAADAREGRNRRDGAVIWFFWSRLVAGFCSRLVAGSGLVACRSSVLEPDTALRTRCLQRHRVVGSSPAEPDRQGPHEAGRSKSPYLQLTFPLSWGYQ